jgi:L-fuculose-phosphate aldolase
VPTPWQIRRRLIELCHEAARKGYVTAYEGNFSSRLPDGHILITPSRKNKGQLAPDDLVIVNEDGSQVIGPGKPSSELRIHTLLYGQRSDIGAVAHAHPPYATAFAVAGVELCVDCMPETFVELGHIPLVPYGTPGTDELPDQLRQFAGSGSAFLLAQHGVVTTGQDAEEAFYRLEMLEQTARIFYLARNLGGARRLNVDEQKKLMDLLEPTP